MSGRVRLIIAVVAVVLVCLLLFLFVIRPRQSELSEVREDVDAATIEQQQLQDQLEVLRDLQDRAPDLQADLEEIRGLVPKTAELSNFILQVQEGANLAGVGLVQIQPELPKQPPEGAQLAEVRMVIRAQGDYFAIQDFVRRLYDLDRALRIDTLGLGQPGATAETAGTTTGTTGTGGGGGTVQPGEIEINLAARIFFELPPGAATGGGAPTETTPTAPASPGASPAPAPTDGAPPAPQSTP
jgi:Tfp pilus assembly protein PilO